MKYKLVKAHHPSAFEKGVYSVLFVEKNKPLVDKNTRFFHVKSSSMKEAIKKAKKML